MNKHILTLLFIGLISSCYMIGNKADKESSPIFVSKGPCLGRCPEYNVSFVRINKNLAFEGLKFTKFIGKKNFKLTKEDKKKLLQAFGGIKLEELKNDYGTKVRDVPLTTFRYRDYSSSYKLKKSVPKELLYFIDVLENTLKQNNLLN